MFRSSPTGGSSSGSGGGITVSSSSKVMSMRSRKTNSTRRAQSLTVFKPAMGTPYQSMSTPSSLTDSNTVLQLLQSALEQTLSSSSSVAVVSGSNSSSSSPSSKKRRRESDSEAAASVNISLRSRGICVGINAVTRAASANELSVVLLCRSVSPLILVAHLPLICQMRHIPLVTMHNLVNSKIIANAVSQANNITTKNDVSMDTDKEASNNQRSHLQMCAAVGIYRDSLAELVDSLKPFASIPTIPWIANSQLAQQKLDDKSKTSPSKKSNQVETLVVRNADTGEKKGRPAKKPKVEQQQQQDGTAATKPAGGKPRMIESATQRKKKLKELRLSNNK